MGNTENPSVLARVGGFSLFVAMTIASLLWFAWNIYSIFKQLTQHPEVIYFDKGSLYMLGIGIGLASLTFAILFEGVLKRELTKKITKIIIRCALVGILIMFLLPQLIHYPVNQHLSDKGYDICQPVSYQWLIYKKLVYTVNSDICIGLERQKTR